MEYIIEALNISHPGKRKDKDGKPHQEDSIYPAEAHPSASDRLFLICDGMGGHDAGEVASSTVCRAIGEYITGRCDTEGEDFSPEILHDAIDSAFDALDSHDTGAAMKMGTTMAMLKLYDKGAVIAHIGDSRVYHIRPGDDDDTPAKVLHRTFDHSLVFEMIQANVMTEEEARLSPHRNVITKAMQPHLEHRPEPDITKITDIRPGDYFYVCSDGMIENMDIPEIERIFAGNDIEQIHQTLLDETSDNDDNHSAFIIHIKSVTGTGDEADLYDAFDAVSQTPSVIPPPADAHTDKETSADSTHSEDILDESDDTVNTSHGSRHRRTVITLIAIVISILAILACLAGYLQF